MKSNPQELAQRGLLNQKLCTAYKDYTISQLYEQINSSDPQVRTTAIHLLGEKQDPNHPQLVSTIINLLTRETALYTKIEISKLLIQGNQQTCTQLLPYLGTIGSNQHKKVPLSTSKKKTYPLPRDIVARILGKTSPNNIDILQKALPSTTISQLAELLDAIGFLVFHNPSLATQQTYQQLYNIQQKNSNNDLILWKLIRCFSAFPLPETKNNLLKLKESITHPTLLQ